MLGRTKKEEGSEAWYSGLDPATELISQPYCTSAAAWLLREEWVAWATLGPSSLQPEQFSDSFALLSYDFPSQDPMAVRVSARSDSWILPNCFQIVSSVAGESRTLVLFVGKFESVGEKLT